MPAIGLPAFIEKLKNGEYKAKKHGRSGRPKKRVLGLTEDQEMILCLPSRQLLPVSPEDPRYQHVIETIVEVRAATEIDRQNPKLLGTPVLRRSCNPEHAHKALSIVWERRTLDLEFDDEEVANEFLNGMRALTGITTVSEANVDGSQRKDGINVERRNSWLAQTDEKLNNKIEGKLIELEFHPQIEEKKAAWKDLFYFSSCCGY
mmetsp:Transcript_11295/g.14673  ORF Transcript_11295/g.14673 Transcript_11295/m.14673 type:complete len:205 (+) Transcript_11295:205-819(+)